MNCAYNLINFLFLFLIKGSPLFVVVVIFVLTALFVCHNASLISARQNNKTPIQIQIQRLYLYLCTCVSLCGCLTRFA